MFRLSIATFAVLALVPNRIQAQRVWGDADELVLGPAASIPMQPAGRAISLSPANPAAVAWSRSAAGLSIAVPMGVRELSVHRTSGRFPLGRTVVSMSGGRLGFDRLVQHRFSIGGARAFPNPATGAAGFAAGVRVSIDRFTSPAAPAACQAALTGGVVLGTARAAFGLVSTWRPAGVEQARLVDISAASVFDLGEQVRASIGASQSSSRRPEFATAIRLDAVEGVAVLASIGTGTSGPGVAAELTQSGVSIRLAWLATGPAGSTRFVSAMVERGIRETPDE